jgi:hypothetical protein
MEQYERQAIRETIGHIVFLVVRCIRITKRLNRECPNSYRLQSFGVTIDKDFTSIDEFRKYARAMARDLSDYAAHLLTIQSYEYAKLQSRLSNIVYRVAECSEMYSRHAWLQSVAADLRDCKAELSEMRCRQISEKSKPSDLRAPMLWHAVGRLSALVEKMRDI